MGRKKKAIVDIEAIKAIEKVDEAPAEAVEEKPEETQWVVKNGHTLRCRKGDLGPGSVVKAEWFDKGEETLAKLEKLGSVEKI